MKIKEILIGDNNLLEFLAQGRKQDSEPHPLQGVVEEALSTLTEDLQDVFYMRYGLHMTIREIAAEQGYEGHQIIQHKLAKIKQVVKEACEQTRITA